MNQNTIKIFEDILLNFRCIEWDDTLKDQIRYFGGEYKIFGQGIFNDVEYYYIEREKYTNDNYFMVKKQDLLPYLKKGSYEIY